MHTFAAPVAVVYNYSALLEHLKRAAVDQAVSPVSELEHFAAQ